MIITVTMNPAIDKTVYVEQLMPGEMHRVGRVEIDYGGKGINVAKVLSELGCKCKAIGLMPKEGSEQMLQSLHKEKISYEFSMVNGRIRTNTKLVEKNGRLTEINEQGCEVSEDELEKLYRSFYDISGEWVVLTGSIPAGVAKDCYAHIIKEVKKRGGRILLDADGEVLYQAISETPDILKINEAEFNRLIEVFPEYAALSEKQICEMLISKGIKEIIITRGEKGVVCYSKAERIAIPAMKVQVSSSVGAGDTFGAAYLYAKEQKFGSKEALYYATAAAAACVETSGTKAPKKERIEELFEYYCRK